MEKILEAANRLGHLLRRHEIVQRYHELGQELEQDETAKKLLEEYVEFATAYREKQEKGETIEVEEKRRLTEFQEKLNENELVSQFSATQAYYMALMQKVNEAIANPQGEPPKESTIITPQDDDKGIIIT